MSSYSTKPVRDSSAHFPDNERLSAELRNERLQRAFGVIYPAEVPETSPSAV